MNTTKRELKHLKVKRRTSKVMCLTPAQKTYLLELTSGNGYTKVSAFVEELLLPRVSYTILYPSRKSEQTSARQRVSLTDKGSILWDEKHHEIGEAFQTNMRHALDKMYLEYLADARKDFEAATC